jgi:hypothetical protein
VDVEIVLLRLDQLISAKLGELLPKRHVLALQAYQLTAQIPDVPYTSGVDSLVDKVTNLGNLDQVIVRIAAGVAFGTSGRNQTAPFHSAKLLLWYTGEFRGNSDGVLWRRGGITLSLRVARLSRHIDASHDLQHTHAW